MRGQEEDKVQVFLNFVVQGYLIFAILAVLSGEDESGLSAFCADDTGSPRTCLRRLLR